MYFFMFVFRTALPDSVTGFMFAGNDATMTAVYSVCDESLFMEPADISCCRAVYGTR